MSVGKCAGCRKRLIKFRSNEHLMMTQIDILKLIARDNQMHPGYCFVLEINFYGDEVDFYSTCAPRTYSSGSTKIFCAYGRVATANWENL